MSKFLFFPPILSKYVLFIKLSTSNLFAIFFKLILLTIISKSIQYYEKYYLTFLK